MGHGQNSIFLIDLMIKAQYLYLLYNHEFFLLGNTPLVKFILNHIWDLGGVILYNNYRELLVNIIIIFTSEDINDITGITKHGKSL